jgi:NAD(P)-dependent dehydrogenase (short-subunit alcohol dehydrogenase family)
LGESAATLLREQKLDVGFVEIDLVRPESIQAAASLIHNDFQRLDVLVNNAGISDPGDGPPSKADIGAVRRVMDTNFFGTLMVTQAMLPLLHKSASGRVVNVSSGLGSLTLNGDPDWEFAHVKRMGYNTSKAAVNMLTVQLAYELRETSIKVNSADPGFTATDLNGHRGYQSVEQGAAEAIRLALLPDDGPTGGFFNSAGPEPW